MRVVEIRARVGVTVACRSRWLRIWVRIWLRVKVRRLRFGFGWTKIIARSIVLG